MNLNLDFLFYIFLGIVWFFAAFIFGFICVNIMRNKGYASLGQWFFFGFFFLLVGLAFCLAMEDKTKQMPTILNEQNAVRCPHCLELTPKSSQFCINCGCKLD